MQTSDRFRSIADYTRLSYTALLNYMFMHNIINRYDDAMIKVVLREHIRLSRYRNKLGFFISVRALE